MCFSCGIIISEHPQQKGIVSVNRGHSITANCPVICYWFFLSSLYTLLYVLSGLSSDYPLSWCCLLWSCCLSLILLSSLIVISSSFFSLIIIIFFPSLVVPYIHFYSHGNKQVIIWFSLHLSHLYSKTWWVCFVLFTCAPSSPLQTGVHRGFRPSL